MRKFCHQVSRFPGHQHRGQLHLFAFSGGGGCWSAPCCRRPYTTTDALVAAMERFRKQPPPLSRTVDFSHLMSRAAQLGTAKRIVKHKSFTKEEKRLVLFLERTLNPPEFEIPLVATPKILSGAMGVPALDILKLTIRLGYKPKRADEVLPADLVDMVAHEFGFIPKRRQYTNGEGNERQQRDTGRGDPNYPRCPPVVTVMGHVNHGKTTLLDALRNTNVASKEAGGITQHLGAFSTTLSSGEKITFLDTPGHAAFSQMRVRGASITDLVVLVVAADEGVMPQTEEAIRVCEEAGVPIIVAINKCEKKNAKPDAVKKQLASLGLQLEASGGDTQVVQLSALANQGLDELTEAILLQTNLMDITADRERPAECAVLEAQLDQGKGIVISALVRCGVLKLNNFFVLGAGWGRIRAMKDSSGASIMKAEPSTPVQIIGYKGTTLPNPGDELIVLNSEEEAKRIATERQLSQKMAEKVSFTTLSSVESQEEPSSQQEENGTSENKEETEENQEQKAEEDPARETTQAIPKELKVVVKSDMTGTLEAAVKLLQDLDSPISLKVVKSGVGDINESDVETATLTGAIVVGFNVKTDRAALELSQRDHVSVESFSVIYQLVSHVEQKIEQHLPPREVEETVGVAKVKELFRLHKKKQSERDRVVAGLTVTRGVIDKRLRFKVVRGDSLEEEDLLKEDADSAVEVLFRGRASSLRYYQEDVLEVQKGYEAGLELGKFVEYKPGDLIVCFKINHVPAKLADYRKKTSKEDKRRSSWMFK
ncbi:Tr-type G domain-containing protein [Balamuthia mandrillaris]